MTLTWRSPLSATAALACLALSAPPTAAEAQFLDKVKKAVKRGAENETLSQVERMARGKVRCVFDDLECIRNAEKSGKGAVLTDDKGEILTDDDGNPVTNAEAGAKVASSGAAARPGEGAWANYDFQPGDDILLFDDFTGDRVGDFPRRFELVEGNFEVVEWEGQRLLRATSGGLIALALPKTLPERFTAEFSVNLTHGNAYVRLMPGRAYYGPARHYQGSVVSVQYGRAGVNSVSGDGPTAMSHLASGTVKDAVVPVRVMADGDYMKVFIDEKRVANVPNAVFPRSDTLFIAVSSASETHPILIGPVRIAGGGRDLYDRLARDGRAATQGILFASGSARIRPESTPTLEEIGTMLKEHPELRLAIEGHTDSDGEDAFNQELSESRAAAVKSYLVERHGIDATRLESAGFGESRPVADNADPEGKQQNRRVELVRLDTKSGG
jgi:outer membrane protein OmpA-like peptidoglycan-associated protein